MPAVGFSHQEGHIEAVLSAFAERPEGDFAACHFSGGTCELLKVTQKKHEASGASSFANLNGESAFWDIEITGGTKDISYGQVLDRAGVAMGMSFPCGQELDLIAIEAKNCTDDLTRINVQDAYVHLSGFDTQIRNTLHIIQNGMFSFIREVFEKMSLAYSEFPGFYGCRTDGSMFAGPNISIPDGYSPSNSSSRKKP